MEVALSVREAEVYPHNGSVIKIPFDEWAMLFNNL